VVCSLPLPCYIRVPLAVCFVIVSIAVQLYSVFQEQAPPTVGDMSGTPARCVYCTYYTRHGCCARSLPSANAKGGHHNQRILEATQSIWLENDLHNFNPLCSPRRYRSGECVRRRLRPSRHRKPDPTENRGQRRRHCIHGKMVPDVHLTDPRRNLLARGSVPYSRLLRSRQRAGKAYLQGRQLDEVCASAVI
jgi:hypothetical protein